MMSVARSATDMAGGARLRSVGTPPIWSDGAVCLILRLAILEMAIDFLARAL